MSSADRSPSPPSTSPAAPLHTRAGRRRAFGPIDAKRFTVAPEFATIAESVPGCGRPPGFIGLFAPAGPPAPITEKLSHEVAPIRAPPGAQAGPPPDRR